MQSEQIGLDLRSRLQTAYFGYRKTDSCCSSVTEARFLIDYDQDDDYEILGMVTLLVGTAARLHVRTVILISAQ